jgi:hypothetical protein
MEPDGVHRARPTARRMNPAVPGTPPTEQILVGGRGGPALARSGALAAGRRRGPGVPPVPRDVPLVSAPRTPPRPPPAAAPRRTLPFVVAAVGALAVGVLLGALVAWATGVGTGPARPSAEVGGAASAWVRHEPAGEVARAPLT